MPAEWQRVREVLETALEMEPSRRAHFLDDACPEPAVRLEVESMIKLHEEVDPDVLNSPAIFSVLPELNLPLQFERGSRVGAYEILEEIAHGGMGVVYKAVRADGQYTQAVAIKIVQSGVGALSATRFRNERQILANLDHPNIARLLDGGTTSDGLPYFVMELIEGLPITEYCDRKKLSIDARLQLFRTVCGAVHYAHQHLVIHRDIKPSNILVCADGVPKLLDFGIAKILEPSPGLQNVTRTAEGPRAMTLEYASPEQVRGEGVTTATDVYSLGLVLYELLTGRHAYQIAGSLPHEVAVAVCNAEPERPSVAARKQTDRVAAGASANELQQRSERRDSSPAKLERILRNDLDNIVLMALRKEPSRRYSSAEQFSDDVRRHVEQIPVIARDDSAVYRAGKFVRRHKAAVVASVAVAATILAALGVTLYEARVAREQAEIARLQRARAEQRFNDVRKLANSLIFEIHDSIKDLPGALAARKLLVERAQEYLDSLSQEASGDIALQRELAAAYDRVGDMQGSTMGANLGDFPAALNSYAKALAIRKASAAANPDDSEALFDLVNDYFRLSFVKQDTGDFQGAVNMAQEGLPVAQALAAKNSDPKYQDRWAGMNWRLGNIYAAAGDHARAAESFRESLRIRKQFAADPNANLEFREHLAADYLELGQELGRSGDVNEGESIAESGLKIGEEVSAADPTNATYQGYLAMGYSDVAELLDREQNYDAALSDSEKSGEMFVKLLSQNPSDMLARINVAYNELDSGSILLHKRDLDRAISYLQKGTAQFEAIPARSRNRYEADGLAEGESLLGEAYLLLAGRDSSASHKREHLLEGRSLLQASLRGSEPGTDRAISGKRRAANEQSRVHLAQCEAALAKLQNAKTNEASAQPTQR